MNGKFLPSYAEKFFAPKLDFSHNVGKSRTVPQIIKGVSHEYKAIVLWHILTGYNVVPGKRKCISQKIWEMLSQSDVRNMYDDAKKIISELYTSEELFGIRHESGEAKDFAYGEWTFNGLESTPLSKLCNTNTPEKRLKKLESCPRFSLFCNKENHWRVYLGCRGDFMVFYDSLSYKDLCVIPKNTVAEETLSVLRK